MLSTPWLNNINRSDILPPMTVSKKVKESKKWKQAVLDSFEHIAQIQFKENLKFWDYYRMIDGKISYHELKDVIPQMGGIQNVLDGVGIPSFLKHYDLLGAIINSLIGKLLDVQDKFNIIDVGEVAQSEILRHKNQQFWKQLQVLIENEVSVALAEAGISPDGRQFESEEEKQQFLQQLEQLKQSFIPKEVESAKNFSYKTAGLRWAESTKEKDIESLEIPKMIKREFKDKVITGRCFREYKIAHENYYARRWNPLTTFFSKEVETEYPQDGEYIGNINWTTPAEIINKHGAYISLDKQKELLGGNENWKSFLGAEAFNGSINETISSGLNNVTRVPFAGFSDYNFYLGLQDELGVPMGDSILFKKDGTQEYGSRFLPRIENINSGSYKNYASILRDDFSHRRDLCQEVTVYFRAYDLWGYLTYEDEKTGRIVTEEVTEDILSDFIKDKNIKTDFKTSLEEIVTSFEVNTLKWVYRPVIYEGVKIQSGNLSEPLYVYCRPMAHQIKGETDFDVKLPVAGYIGNSLVSKLMPYQSNYNLVMNQIQNLIEKELGMFFLIDIGLLPSEVDGWGDAEDALINFRNIAKDIGLFPVKTSADGQGSNNPFNQFSVHNLSASTQIQTRIQLAELYKSKMYESIGFNPNMFLQATRYETTEGIKISNEANFLQIADIYDEFSLHERRAWELHLSVAQYCQSNKKDLTLYYTKSDSSIEFLKISDPDFPLRRFGLLPSKDPKRKKELEEFKMYLLQNNTLKNDLLDIARLRTSDTMLEAIEILKKSKEETQKQEQMMYQQQQEMLAKEGEQRHALEVEKQNREDNRAKESNLTKIKVAELNAIGKAADKQSDPESFELINETADNSKLSLEQDNKMKIHEDKMNFQKENMSEKLKLEWEKIRQKDRELDVREKVSENTVINSTINKN